ncbi:hypothetical protein BK004_03645 [bacterium CG10_46_32]|uniref:Adenine DNA glycosylase n=1 Tax=Candidatus Campbellbacteria bacterium CG22_combo_CG10-13_8_21_14_all_43_18 TaxID=1974530 RepID=A0A2H0DXI7_9BACT|nr:MAG: hypothetical protein BK004_03645 [bacterium CG10_46_32]PIP86300.1 MAG: endonuclease III [Candidatus Campbellbacteria bacterium CG22_combo_CG10-13_8_21_14_all_43_18]PIR55892.1 MAG: endonuclease III [Parcubacteria group bacterium CG10_big_fil_rev_8_21_14_0_10_46_32]
MTTKTPAQPQRASKPLGATLSAKQVQAFQNRVYSHYRENARIFPWRTTRDPYGILVSEIMLQQTQTHRVVPKYTAFIERFPTIQKLAAAQLSSVLRAWQGLGYNRRAKMLHQAARQIVKNYGGRIPTSTDTLQQLPGIGPYTAAAVMVFAFNTPTVMIETNIRSVCLHYFFPEEKNVDDAALMPLIEQTLDAKNPRTWYAGLMDYGAHIKQTVPNPSRNSRHHAKQQKFEGSNRQIRGSIIKLLIAQPRQTAAALTRALAADQKRVATILVQMQNEGLLKKRGTRFVAG